MAKYYALIAGLPNITVDSPKPPFTTASFYEELLPILTKQDLQLLEVLRQEALNKELLNWIAADTDCRACRRIISGLNASTASPE